MHGLHHILPNLEYFNIRTQVVYRLGLPENFVVVAALYGCAYATLLLLGSMVIFRRKDL